ncbi:MAG: hypothetical protein AUJ75_01845 [Candidatus Omnitrophica bacterium CG1_02_49_10]|nr:MAG: hypothetical protein AUJ75_01845 [Candidatus Omnitrophica bacterium CG1_02_49_10]
MNTRRGICVSIFAIILTCGILAHADDAPIPTDQLTNKIMPALNQASQKVNEQDVGFHNDAESNKGDIEETRYREDGLIDSVTYVDGTTVKYSYEWAGSQDIKDASQADNFSDAQALRADINGKRDPTKVTLSSNDGVTSTFFEDKGQTMVLIYDSVKPDGPATAVAVPVGEVKPADLARQPVPFDFKGIKKALDRVSEEKEEALKRYAKDTEPYYEKIATELGKISGDLEAEGVIVKTDPDFMGEKGEAFDENKRKAIDETVRYVRGEAAKIIREAPDRQSAEFLEIERSLKEEFLDPNKEIYDGKVKKAVEHLNGVVDELINSKIAIYFKSKGDRIDALIRLPKRTDE